MLHRYWFLFDPKELHNSLPVLNLGCGVTAYSKTEAITLIRETFAKLFINHTLPEIVECIEDVDVSQLDPNHIRPNMGNCVRLGIWFPLGFT